VSSGGYVSTGGFLSAGGFVGTGAYTNAGGNPGGGGAGGRGGAGGSGGKDGGTITDGAFDGDGWTASKWVAGCDGTTPRATTGAWFAAVDSYQGTSTITSPCAGGAGAKCPPTPITCSAGGRNGTYDIHLTGTKAKGSVYAGVSFGGPTGTPNGSKGISFWYKTSGTALGGNVQVDLGLLDDILVTDWMAPGLGTCLAPNYDYILNQCWNNPFTKIAASADWKQVTLLWRDFIVVPYQTTIPAWWPNALAAMDQHIIFIRFGLIHDTDRLSDAGTAIIGSVDVWIDGVTLVAQ
jgi:hypothetical protein